MGRIQSNVGLITGIPITDTVNQLIGVAARPRDLLTSRTQGLQQQRVAISTLSSRVLSLKFDLGRLKVSDPFQARGVTSSNPELISATLNGNTKPTLGSFALQPAQTASSQQIISQRFETLDDIQSAGSFSFGFGGFVDKGISLDELNNGEGVARGEIRITDLDGNSAVVDLSLVQTVDDVIEAINNESTLNVIAAADGDSFTLTDSTDGSGTLTVREINGGTTAADLGLTTTAVDGVITGTDVYGLHSGTKLAKLNDGNGVRFTDDTDELDINDLQFTFADGSLAEDGETKLGVDLSGAATLGDVVDAINNDEILNEKVTAKISADGNRLELEDLTSGTGSFSVSNGNAGSAADDLGIAGEAAGSVITGERLVSGLRDTLVSSLNGGQGVELGDISITDRDGTNATVELAAAENLSDIIETINASAANVTASINEARNGITITDNTGGSGNLIIENSGATTTADSLGIAFNAAEDLINTGSLSRQQFSEATLLSSLNGGEGIEASDIRITDSDGGDGVSIDLNTTGKEAKTIGDVIDAINATSSLEVTARINDTGDGILITNTASGSETLKIEDVNGTLAADLNLTGSSKTIDIDGQATQVVDGTSSFNIDLTDLAENSSAISLASLNDGAGINRGDIRITDSAGRVTGLDLNSDNSGIETVEQLIEAINSGGANVTASLNEAGTGIKLVDNSTGDGTLTVEDVNGTAASELKILSTDNTTDTINGSSIFASRSASQGALNNLASQINDLESGVTASVLNDGKGYRLQLVVDETGSANEILVDSGSSNFDFSETSSARDGLLVVGAGSIAGSGVLVSSSNNDFNEVIDGVDLTALSSSDDAIDVTIEENDQEIVDLVQSFVDSYNTLRGDLGDLTSFDENDLSTGLLFGTSEALRVDTELSRLITDRYSGLGEFNTLQEIGISVNDTGELSLDAAKLKEAFAEDSVSLQNLFTAEESGVVAKFDAAIERLAGDENGLLTNRNESLQATIDANNDRIERFNESLERQRERLELQFFQLEQVISGLQNSRTAISNIQSIPALTSTA